MDKTTSSTLMIIQLLLCVAEHLLAAPTRQMTSFGSTVDLQRQIDTSEAAAAAEIAASELRSKSKRSPDDVIPNVSTFKLETRSKRHSGKYNRENALLI